MSAPVSAPGAATEDLLAELKLARDQAHAANVELGELRVQLEVATARIAGLEAERDHLQSELESGAKTWANTARLAHEQLTQLCREHREAREKAEAERDALRAERDALAKFKAYVHQRLDEAGIPTHPNGPHSAQGCRVGDRLDFVLGIAPGAVAEIVRRASEVPGLTATLDELRARVSALEGVLGQYANRANWMADGTHDEMVLRVGDGEGPTLAAALASPSRPSEPEDRNDYLDPPLNCGTFAPPSEPEGRARYLAALKKQADAANLLPVAPPEPASGPDPDYAAAPPPPAKPAEPNPLAFLTEGVRPPNEEEAQMIKAVRATYAATEDALDPWLADHVGAVAKIQRQARDRALEEAAQAADGWGLLDPTRQPREKDVQGARRANLIAKDIRALKSQPSPAPQEPHDTFDLIAHLRRQAAWSEATFGPGERTAGVLDHIRKELGEIEANPGDLTEWIDVVILAFDGARRVGFSPGEIASRLAEKQAKNERRKWPDWRTAEPGKAIEHVREPEVNRG